MPQARHERRDRPAASRPVQESRTAAERDLGCVDQLAPARRSLAQDASLPDRALFLMQAGWCAVRESSITAAQRAAMVRYSGEPYFANALSGWLAFKVRTGESACDIYAVSPDGSDIRQVVSVGDTTPSSSCARGASAAAARPVAV
jgi:hypothetical protein